MAVKHTEQRVLGSDLVPLSVCTPVSENPAPDMGMKNDVPGSD